MCNFGGRVIGQFISYGRLLKATEGLNWMWCFHGLQSLANDTSDAWSSTWTQRGHDDVCWPEKWLPLDLGDAVRIFSVSYNAHVVSSPHGHVSEIADNLFQTLFNPR